MVALTEQKIIEIMRNEWNKHVKSIEEKIDMSMKIDGTNKNIVGVETKVKHNKSNLLYTVSEINPKIVVLKTPENKQFSISAKEFETDYSLA